MAEFTIDELSIPDLPGERIPSPTGFGSISADHPDVRFLQKRGYRLEQIERLSRLALPVNGVEALVIAAQERSGPDYLPHYWIARTPERWQGDLANLLTHMSTDAPSAGLEEPEDVWTVERVIESDSRMGSRPRYTVVIEHLRTGHLVGFSKLSVPAQTHRAVDQYGTLVLKEHRGHALGMLMKVGNIAHLQR